MCSVKHLPVQTKMELQDALMISQGDEMDCVIEVESSIDANATYARLLGFITAPIKLFLYKSIVLSLSTDIFCLSFQYFETICKPGGKSCCKHPLKISCSKFHFRWRLPLQDR